MMTFYRMTIEAEHGFYSFEFDTEAEALRKFSMYVKNAPKNKIILTEEDLNVETSESTSKRIAMYDNLG